MIKSSHSFLRLYYAEMLSALVFLFMAYPIVPVAGHGYVHTVAVGGQEYPGWNPFNDP